jgi:hypothetical protein
MSTAKREEKRRLIKRKKREREQEEVELCRTENDARNFYKKLKRLTEGSRPRAASCKDKNFNLVTDAAGLLLLHASMWR